MHMQCCWSTLTSVHSHRLTLTIYSIPSSSPVSINYYYTYIKARQEVHYCCMWGGLDWWWIAAYHPQISHLLAVNHTSTHTHTQIALYYKTYTCSLAQVESAACFCCSAVAFNLIVLSAALFDSCNSVCMRCSYIYIYTCPLTNWSMHYSTLETMKDRSAHTESLAASFWKWSMSSQYFSDLATLCVNQRQYLSEASLLVSDQIRLTAVCCCWSRSKSDWSLWFSA